MSSGTFAMSCPFSLLLVFGLWSLFFCVNLQDDSSWRQRPKTKDQGFISALVCRTGSLLLAPQSVGREHLSVFAGPRLQIQPERKPIQYFYSSRAPDFQM